MTTAELLKLTPQAFKKECHRVHNRIRSLERKNDKTGLTETLKQELGSLREYTGNFSEAIRQWF